MLTLKTGDLAYYDSLAGCLPCKVLSITGHSGPGGSSQTVTFKLTADRSRYGFKRSEVLTAWGLHVCPRRAVHGNRIRFYTVQAD